MVLTTQNVKAFAFQIRVLFSADELDRATNAVNAMFEKNTVFAEIVTDGVEPLFFGNTKRNVFRDDVVGRSLSIDATMQNSPKHDNDCFLFPAVLG